MSEPDTHPRPRLRALWWTLGFVLLTVISVLSLMPLNGPVIDLPSSDKLLHALAYSVLTVYFGALVGTRGAALAKVIAGLIAYGIAIELAQSMLPPRSAELADLAANLTGMAIGALLLRTRLGRVLWGIERVVGRRTNDEP
jgi:VanZ family protein